MPLCLSVRLGPTRSPGVPEHHIQVRARFIRTPAAVGCVWVQAVNSISASLADLVTY